MMFFKNFISSRLNLTILQFMCYFVIGYIMGEYLDWVQFGIIFIVLFIIQFITRTKAVADGMMFRQLMLDNQVDANEIIRMMKKEQDKINKKDLN